jgi:excisionase family DNA binding protein
MISNRTLEKPESISLLFSNISNKFEAMKSFSLSPLDQELIRQLLDASALKLTSGKSLEISVALREVLGAMESALATGAQISIVLHSKMLTTQEAADLVDVSRPTLVRMLGKYQIPYETVGRHRRVSFDNVLKIKDAWNKERVLMASKMRRLSQLEHENFELLKDNPLITK